MFGPVEQPLYSVLVRPDHFQEIEEGALMRFSTKHMQLVSKAALREDRGIDADPASPEFFSDDEEEKKTKKGFETGEISD